MSLPLPDLDATPVRFVAGLRPKRRGSYRLEAVRQGRKTIIHNYGHGGAGITLCWGCAEEVLHLVRTAEPASPSGPIAILGAGVMGLTAATMLLRAGYKLHVYTLALPAASTSSIAGGPWSPSLVDYDPTPEGQAAFERLLRHSFRAYERCLGRGYGVARADLYTPVPSLSLSKLPTDLIPEPEYLDLLPFPAVSGSGFRYETLMIEPPILLARLERDLRMAGVSIETRRFACAGDVDALPEGLVVNCTGLGSREIWPDSRLHPIKGQLAILPPQPGLDYLFSDQCGYVFPRSDGVVVGGTYTFEEDPTPEPEVCRGLIQRMKSKLGLPLL